MDIANMIGMVEKLATIIALVVGGVWTYFHFIKGRIYRPRLGAKIVGSVEVEDDLIYLLVTSTITNIGKSKVDLQHDGTAVRVFGYAPTSHPEGIQTVDWKRLGTYSVFENHGWLEGEETVDEQRLFLIPAQEYRAFRLELRVICSKIAWTDAQIVTTLPKQEVQSA
jgi:hypothetical protein